MNLLLHLPHWVFLLLVILAVGIAVIKLLYLLNNHKKHYFALISFPKISQEEKELYIEQMKGVFDSLFSSIKSQTNKIFIEITKPQGNASIQIQIGSNKKEVLDQAKHAFSHIDNITIVDTETDILSVLPKTEVKTINDTKSFYTIEKNIYFFDSIITYLSSLKEEEYGGIQCMLRGVKKRDAISWELYLLDEKRKREHRSSYTIDEQEKRDEYLAKRRENIFKTKIYAFGSTKQIISILSAKFSSLNHKGNELRSRRGLRKNLMKRYIAPDTPVAWFLPDIRKFEGMYFTASELAILFHPPTVQTGLYKPNQTRILSATPEFLEQKEDNIYIGTTTNTLGNKQDIYFPEKSFERHMYAVGKTGRGKSSFLTSLTSDLIDKNRDTVFIVDPHGDLSRDIIAVVKNKEALVYLNIKGQDRIFTCNPIFCFRKSETEKAIIKEMLVNIYKEIAEEKTGDYQIGMQSQNRIEEIIEIAVEFADAYYHYLTIVLKEDLERAEALVKERQLTLNDLPYILDKDRSYIRMLQTVFQGVKSTTALEVENSLEKHANNQMVVDAVQARLKPLLFSSLEYVFEGNKLDIQSIMTSGKAFLIPITDSIFGENGAKGLIQILFSVLWMEKEGVPEGKRKNTYLIIDECQKAQISKISRILEEGRKFKLLLALANQQLGQLKSSIKDSILGNIGTMVTFTVGADKIGARELEPYYNGLVSQDELVNLEPNMAYLRTDSGRLKATFSFNTIPLPTDTKDEEEIEAINKRSLEQYGEDKKILKEKIYHKRNSAFTYFTDL